MLDVSVVVPTIGRTKLLERCLAALVRQEMAHDRYEIIVVDDRPSENTRAVVLRTMARALCRTRSPLIYYLANTGLHGPAAARNLGWRAAQAPLIAFTDDDTIPDSGWLLAGLSAMSEERSAIWGRVVVPLPPRPTDYEHDAAGLERAGFVTANCFVRREALAAIGGFDTRFRAAWREDSDLFFTLIERKLKVAPAPQAIVVHPVRPAQWGVSIGQQRKSQFDALLFKKHRGLYRAVVNTHPPWRYYAMALCLLAAMLAAASGHLVITAWLLAAWAILTLDFALARLSGTSRSLPHIIEMLWTSAVIPPVAIFWRLAGAVRFRVLFI